MEQCLFQFNWSGDTTVWILSAFNSYKHSTKSKMADYFIIIHLTFLSSDSNVL